MKIPNKRELEQIAINHSSDVSFKDFMKIYRKRTVKPYSFLVNDTFLPSAKLNLVILLLVKLLKNKQKQLKIKDKIKLML